VVDVPLPGLASVAGGKFTTYRLMARDVVDAAVDDFPRPVPASVTDQLPLLGAAGLPAVRAASVPSPRRARSRQANGHPALKAQGGIFTRIACRNGPR
jgi:glycerol-3-phosphate dehydrogenase